MTGLAVAILYRQRYLRTLQIIASRTTGLVGRKTLRRHRVSYLGFAPPKSPITCYL
jgi:hypothetical protein